MNRVVLDSSAVLALLDFETGADVVFAVLNKAVISAVNLAEVHAKLLERGRDATEALALVLSAVTDILPFTAELAELTGSLRTSTRHLGLSLGDRACLATGVAFGFEVYTADEAWATLDLPCAVRLIR